jgi:EF-P beta-lysylation protein EpmB
VIPRIETLPTPPDWQRQLRDAVRSGSELLELLGLAPDEVGLSEAAARDFPLKVPMAYIRRIRPGDPEDPLLLQVLASRRELTVAPGYSRDPVGETDGVNPQPGVIQKYRGRALLIVSGGCAINCRYCFRRHFPYADNRNSREDWPRALARLETEPSITEVILSGGDPLVVSDTSLHQLIDHIAGIEQVTRLRIHTRMPVVVPDRVTRPLLQAISRDRIQTTVVIHCNHANEIDDDAGAALGRLREAGITLLNQSVLLAGVNDGADALVDLSERLFEVGVLPYYLHLLDRVQGAAHFDVPEQRARQLMAEVAARLPGYLVPRLVREVAGAASKIVLEPRYPG